MHKKRLLSLFLVVLVLVIFGCTPQTPAITEQPSVPEPLVIENVPAVEEVQEVAEVTEQPTPAEPATPQTRGRSTGAGR